MRLFLCQKTTNKVDVLQKSTILGGGVHQKVYTLFAHLRYFNKKWEIFFNYYEKVPLLRIMFIFRVWLEQK